MWQYQVQHAGPSLGQNIGKVMLARDKDKHMCSRLTVCITICFACALRWPFNMITKPEVGARKLHRQHDMDDKRHKSVNTGDATGSVAGQCDLIRAAI